MTPAADRRRAPRSLLFVPATRPELVAKLDRWRPDVAVVDLEDAVPAADKDAARRTAADTATTHRGLTPLLLRVNGPDTAWFDADVHAAAGAPFAGVVLPKCETAEQLTVLAERLAAAGRGEMVVIAGVETVRGVANCEALAAGRVDAVYFGAEDFIADLGGRRTRGGLEVLHARSRVVLAARLSGVHPVDQAVVDPRDEAAFTDDADTGRDLGYRGKICIHPGQVALAHEAFTPSPAEVTHARAVLAAVGQPGRPGVAVVDGQMVDAVHLRAARSVLHAAGEA